MCLQRPAISQTPDPGCSHALQGEPEFDRLKRELEDVKNQPRGLEGTFRTAAEMERHRAQVADAAIEEQLEVQTAFREHGARLQVDCQRSRLQALYSRRLDTINRAPWKVNQEAASVFTATIAVLMCVLSCMVSQCSQGRFGVR